MESDQSKKEIVEIDQEKKEINFEEVNNFRKIEKVLAPFLQSFKIRKHHKHDKAKVSSPDYDELYLKPNPKDLLISLQNTFTDVIELKTIMNETAELLKVVTKSKSVNLYFTDYESGDIILCPKYYPENARFERRYPIESGTYLAAHVAFTKEYIISSDILDDVRFPRGIPEVSIVKSVICLPIITNVEGNCIGVIELYREWSDRPYDLVNLQICNALTAWMGIAVEQNKERLNLVKNYEIQFKCFDLTYSYFSKALPFSKTISDLIQLAKAAINADKGAFYLFHEAVLLESKDILIADAYKEEIDNFGESVLYKKKASARFVDNQPGLAGYVARSGEIINIRDAYKDDRFNQKSDSPFYRTRSIVAFPIKNQNGVIAVLELINCLNHSYFQTEDVDTFQSFLSYISIVCEYFILSMSHNKMKTKSLISDRLLDFYSAPSAQEINILISIIEDRPPLSNNFFDFELDEIFREEEILRQIIYVFFYSDILEPFFEMKNFLDFLLRIKKSYRSVFYHNFTHAFYVFHTTFVIISKNKNYYTEAEKVTMLLAAFCHDIDHPGLTNDFLSLTNDPIYALYGDCCGETHRFELVLFLIEQTGLFSTVSDDTSKVILMNLKKLFLGFDLGIHFQYRRKIINLLNNYSFDWKNPEHRLLSQNLILFFSDYSIHLKSCEMSKEYTDRLNEELSRQGELEKLFGFSLLPIPDREDDVSYSQNQIILLTLVVQPVIELLISFFPNLTILNEYLSDMIEEWKKIIENQSEEMWELNQSLLDERRASFDLGLSDSLSSIDTNSSDVDLPNTV